MPPCSMVITRASSSSELPPSIKPQKPSSQSSSSSSSFSSSSSSASSAVVDMPAVRGGRMRAFGSTDFEQRERQAFLLPDSDFNAAHEAQNLPSARASFSSCVDALTKPDLPVYVAHQAPFLAEKDRASAVIREDRDSTSSEKEVVLEEAAMAPAVSSTGCSRVQRVNTTAREPVSRASNQEDGAFQPPEKIKRGAFGLALERAMSSIEDGDICQSRHSFSTSYGMREKTSRRSLHKTCEGPSLEEAVRRALSINEKPSCTIAKHNKPGFKAGLLRSNSVREHGPQQCTDKRSFLPPTIILKRANTKCSLHGRSDAALACEEAQFSHKLASSCKARKSNVGIADEKGTAGIVKSPSEKRWEEAAEDEERQERERRQRRSSLQSQSMRYEREEGERMVYAAIEDEEEGAGGEEEWAVYRRSGYISVRPSKEKGEDQWRRFRRGPVVGGGRSWSMREVEGAAAPVLPGLHHLQVPECSGCGELVHTCGARLLCPCCVALHLASPPRAPPKAKKGGILSACRRILGLAKKRPSPGMKLHEQLHP